MTNLFNAFVSLLSSLNIKPDFRKKNFKEAKALINSGDFAPLDYPSHWIA